MFWPILSVDYSYLGTYIKSLDVCNVVCAPATLASGPDTLIPRCAPLLTSSD